VIDREPRAVLLPEVDPPSLAHTGGTIIVDNDHGSWLVHTSCLGHGRGPGYVSRVVTREGRVLVDDPLEPGSLNDPRYGGLGTFGWHHARGTPRALRLTGDNAWEINGRTCAAANRGFGVARAELVEQPHVVEGSQRFAIAVSFRDAWATVMRATYRYRFERDRVRVRVDVEELCPAGRCGATQDRAFVKEPKVVAHANGSGADYTGTVTLSGDGEPVCRYDGRGPASGPIVATGQCGHEDRAAVRFEGGTSDALVVRVDDVDFRQWAHVASLRPPALDVDTDSGDGVVWSCHGGVPSLPLVQRWEVYARESGETGALFPAWQGGRGAYDCEPLSRLFGDDVWSITLQYRLEASS
jgi:hypothetical protein